MGESLPEWLQNVELMTDAEFAEWDEQQAQMYLEADDLFAEWSPER